MQTIEQFTTALALAVSELNADRETAFVIACDGAVTKFTGNKPDKESIVIKWDDDRELRVITSASGFVISHDFSSMFRSAYEIACSAMYNERLVREMYKVSASQMPHYLAKNNKGFSLAVYTASVKEGDNPTVSFYANYVDLFRKRKTELRLGSFLLDNGVSGEAMHTIVGSYKPAAVFFTETAEEVRDFYERRSATGSIAACMSKPAASLMQRPNNDSGQGKDCPHVTQFYTGDLAVAYITADNTQKGTVTARTVVDRNNKVFIRTYGDSARLASALRAHGYNSSTVITDAHVDLHVQRFGMCEYISLPYLDATFGPYLHAYEKKDGTYGGFLSKSHSPPSNTDEKRFFAVPVAASERHFVICLRRDGKKAIVRCGYAPARVIATEEYTGLVFDDYIVSGLIRATYADEQEQRKVWFSPGKLAAEDSRYLVRVTDDGSIAVASKGTLVRYGVTEASVMALTNRFSAFDSRAQAATGLPATVNIGGEECTAKFPPSDIVQTIKSDGTRTCTHVALYKGEFVVVGDNLFTDIVSSKFALRAEFVEIMKKLRQSRAKTPSRLSVMAEELGIDEIIDIANLMPSLRGAKSTGARIASLMPVVSELRSAVRNAADSAEKVAV